MAKPTLTVLTEFGTFTRQTARTYTHLVIAKGYRSELLEANRLVAIEYDRKQADKMRQTVATGVSPDWRPAGTAGGNWDRECTAKFLAEGEFEKWIAQHEANAARLEAHGPITEDRDNYGMSDDALATAPTWGVLGWCGRLDLARKLSLTNEAARYREVHIIDVTTGKVSS